MVMPMTDVEERAWGIIALSDREEALKPKLAALIARREEAEAAEAKLRDERDALTAYKQQVEADINSKKAEIAQAQAEHDRIAQESAARIRVGNEQAADITRREEELAKREKAANALQRDLTQREKALADGMRRLQDDMTKVNELKASLEARIAKIREAAA